MPIIATMDRERLAASQARIEAASHADRGHLPGNPLRARTEALRLRLSYDHAVIRGDTTGQRELAFMIGL